MLRFSIYLFQYKRSTCSRWFLRPSSGALYTVWVPNDGRRNRLKHVERLYWNKLRNYHLVGCTFGMYLQLCQDVAVVSKWDIKRKQRNSIAWMFESVLKRPLSPRNVYAYLQLPARIPQNLLRWCQYSCITTTSTVTDVSCLWETFSS
jgi:hypothetical protein